MDYNYYNTSINYFDRSDYVSTIIQELLYVEAIEIFIQSNTYLFSLYIRIMYMEIFRVLNHYLAITTHIMDIGLFTCFLRGFEEREKLLNYIESISGSRLHNVLFTVNSIGVDFEKPSMNIIMMLLLGMVVKYKELSYILSTVSLFISRLYHIGIWSLVYCMYVCMSGVIMRASYISFDGRMMERGLGRYLEYYIYISSNSDCLDRYMIRINESLNSVYVVYGVCYVSIMCMMGMVSKSMMQSIIGWVVGGCWIVGLGMVVDGGGQWIRYWIESSKGIYCIMLGGVFKYVCSVEGLYDVCSMEGWYDVCSMEVIYGCVMSSVCSSVGVGMCEWWGYDGSMCDRWNNRLSLGCGLLLSDYVSMSGMSSMCRVYNVGDVIAVLGSVDFVLGSVDI